MYTHLFAALLLTQASPAPPQQDPARGRIEGVVLRAASNDPVIGARVTLSRPSELNTGTSVTTTGAGSSVNLFQVPPVPTTTSNTPPPPTSLPPPPLAPVVTDNGGRFTFSNLEAGTFRLFVNLDGYVRQEYGQRVFPGQGTPLTITTGAVLKDRTIRMTPTGNVGGRIVDGLGKPAVGVPLVLMKAVYTQAGQRAFQIAGNARTNDRGEYRFYWVTPGRYYLAGGTPQGPPQGIGPGNAPASPNESGESYTFTYFPGVTDITRAIAIEVVPGGDFVADFFVPKQQLFTIRGRIVDPALAGVGPPSASIALAYQQANGANTMFSRNPLYHPATGAFELREVLPGPYVLYANTLGGSARMPIEVVNADIDGVVLAVNAGLTINGQVSVDQGRLPSTGVRVQFRPVIAGSLAMVGNMPQTQGINPDGTFTIANVLPGQYRIIALTPPEFYVKQVRFDRFDGSSQTVDVVQRGLETPTVDVVLSPNVGQLEGVVSDAKAGGAAGVSIVLIPDANRDRIDLYKTATTDQSGRFTLRGIAPGEYKVFAWETLEPNGYFDPDLLRRSESSGRAVRVTESSKQSIDVRVIPAN